MTFLVVVVVVAVVVVGVGVGVVVAVVVVLPVVVVVVVATAVVVVVIIVVVVIVVRSLYCTPIFLQFRPSQDREASHVGSIGSIIMDMNMDFMINHVNMSIVIQIIIGMHINIKIIMNIQMDFSIRVC